MLSARADEAALQIERIAYSGDQPIELRRSIVRGDLARFAIEPAGPDLASIEPSPKEGSTWP